MIGVILAVVLGLFSSTKKKVTNNNNQELYAMQAKSKIMGLKIIQDHLNPFLVKNPEATYEEWIAHIHPDNVHNGIVDDRMYFKMSDHRILWNKMHTVLKKHRHIPAIENKIDDSLNNNNS